MGTEKLQDVLDAYVEATGEKPSLTTLKGWIKLYPQFRQELIEFTVHWSVMDTLPPPDIAEEVDEDTLVLRAMSIVSDRLHAHSRQDSVVEPDIIDLLREIKRAGLKPQGLAKQCDLSQAILTKLARRLIDPVSIPERLIDCLSSAIGKKAESIYVYFQGGMTLAANARYHAKVTPKLPDKQENFFDAIRADRTMHDKQRELWLAYERHRVTR